MKQILDYIRKRKQEEQKPFCAFIYDLAALRRHVKERVESLPPGSRFFYAIKANSEKPILEALAPLVHGFEVASLGEIRKVREVSSDIPVIFGGPGKTDEEMAGAIENRVSLIHAESLHELRRIAHIAKRKETVVPILLRVNLRSPLPAATLSMGGRPTQFGIDEEMIPEAIRLALSLPEVKLEGFHLHSLSNNLDALQHVRLVQSYCGRVKEWIRQFGLKISYLNAGGGIGVNYSELEQQFDWPAFVENLGPVLESDRPEGVTVLFECGRYVTAACGFYAAEVLDIKRNHGKNYAIIRGGTNHFRLPVSWQHSHPFEMVPIEQWPYPYERKTWENEEMTVVGQLCTPKDVLAKEVPVERIRIGDIVLFVYAGAYGWSISHHDFLSHPHPEHIYLDGETDGRL